MPRGLDHLLVVVAVGRRGGNSFAIDFLNRMLAVGRGFHSEAAAEEVINGPIAVPDRRQSAASQIDVLKIVRTRLGVNGCAGRLRPVA